MLRQSIILQDIPLSLLPKHKRACTLMCIYVIIQCILVFIGAATIHFCLWVPEHTAPDYDTLARIMYLYDPGACGYKLRTSNAMINVRLSNETYGLNVLPIKWMPADVTVSTRLSSKSRRYIHMSFFFHLIWCASAIALILFKSVKRSRLIKIILFLFFYATLFMIFFDLSIAIVYIAHIQQSVTKGMILRYSGWAVEMKITNHDDFGGWWPLAATVCWLRGIVFFCINIYCCREIYLVRRRLAKTELGKRLQLHENNLQIPDEDTRPPIGHGVLYYKRGEKKPITMRSFL